MKASVAEIELAELGEECALRGRRSALSPAEEVEEDHLIAFGVVGVKSRRNWGANA